MAVKKYDNDPEMKKLYIQRLWKRYKAFRRNPLIWFLGLGGGILILLLILGDHIFQFESDIDAESIRLPLAWIIMSIFQIALPVTSHLGHYDGARKQFDGLVVHGRYFAGYGLLMFYKIPRPSIWIGFGVIGVVWVFSLLIQQYTPLYRMGIQRMLRKPSHVSHWVANRIPDAIPWLVLLIGSIVLLSIQLMNVSMTAPMTRLNVLLAELGAPILFTSITMLGLMVFDVMLWLNEGAIREQLERDEIELLWVRQRLGCWIDGDPEYVFVAQSKTYSMDTIGDATESIQHNITKMLRQPNLGMSSRTLQRQCHDVVIKLTVYVDVHVRAHLKDRNLDKAWLDQAMRLPMQYMEQACEIKRQLRTLRGGANDRQGKHSSIAE